jgi:hypothetical protein
MTLIIEDGSGVPGAESYVTAEELDAFALAYWGAALTGTEAVKEAALRRAGAYLNGLSWMGQKTNGRDGQSMAWPRAWVMDIDGYPVATDEIPEEVKQAQFILARAEITEAGALSPTVTPSKQKTLVAVEGIRWEAAGAGSTATSARAHVTDAMDRLKGLVRAVGTAQVYRA